MENKKENQGFVLYFISNIKRSSVRVNVLLKKLPLFVIIGGFALAIGCNQEGRGLALPPGDREEGKTTFVRLGCDECHSAANIEWKGIPGDINFELGGEVTRIKTYGELVTAIINPSHKIAKRYQQQTNTDEEISKMRMYNDVMTVQELVDLVTFLQPEYEVTVPDTGYRQY